MMSASEMEHAGKITRELAEEKALTEFNRFDGERLLSEAFEDDIDDGNIEVLEGIIRDHR